jgi:hypothetical protein
MSNEIISTTIVPAPAGFYLLWASRYEAECFVDKAPIVAWKVVLYENDKFEREPITATDENCFSNANCFDLAVLAPDGAVYSLENSEQFTEERWTKRAEEMFARTLEREKAKKAAA